MKISDPFITLFSHHKVIWKQKFDSLFADLNLPQLTERDRDFLDAPIEDISQAIRSMQPNKFPGLDGLPADCYGTLNYVARGLL